jgi:hypothetical protein
VTLSLEDLDLAELTRCLRERLAGSPPTGYLIGRTALRDAVTDELECSELVAEEIVDTLVARGFVRYQGDPTAEIDEPRGWSLG